MIYAFDLETYLMYPGNPAPKGVCLSFAGEDGSTGLMLMAEGLRWLRARLEGGDHLIAHNAPFDFSVAAADEPSLLPLIFKAYDEGRIHDTGIRQKIIDNAKGILKYEWNEEIGEYKAQRYSLAHLVYRLLDKWIFNSKEGDTCRLQYSTLVNVPIEEWPEGARTYALEDSIYALACFQKQNEDRFAYLFSKEHTQTQADWALRLMSIWGSRTNQEDIDRLKESLQEAYDEQLEICRRLKLMNKTRIAKTDPVEYKWTRNMTAIQELVERHYTNHGLDIPRTATGKISTSRGTLTMEEYPGLKGSEGMLAISELVKIGKQISTYIPTIEAGTRVPISPRYNCILETYRTSCSKPNCQNIPRKGGIRECWYARPGYVYGFCDYDTLEMRTLAQVCIWLFGYSRIAEAIKEGKDLHTAFAANMLMMDYEEAMRLVEEEDPFLLSARQGNKISNYGMAGGMGPDAFISYARGFGIEISIEDAEKLHRGFREMWPEMNQYFAHCSQLVDQIDPDLGVNLIEFLGSGLVRGNVKYTAVCNSYFQHLAAMGAKQACYAVSRECYVNPQSPLYGCRPWLFAHDEIGLEVPFDGTDAGRVRASRAMAELERIMVDSMKFYCPDVDIGATGALCFQWLKGAKPVYREIEGEKVLVPGCKGEKGWVEDEHVQRV